MYSTLMLSELVEARYAARLAEAEQRRARRELLAAQPRHTWIRLHAAWRLPALRIRRRRTSCATCPVAR